MRPYQQKLNRYSMTFSAKARRRIQKISPYLSLLVLLVPLLLVEPLKIAALFVVGKGHWITGTGILVAAYIVSLMFVERLFRVLKPKLLMLPWFAQLWRWYEMARNKPSRRSPHRRRTPPRCRVAGCAGRRNLTCHRPLATPLPHLSRTMPCRWRNAASVISG